MLRKGKSKVFGHVEEHYRYVTLPHLQKCRCIITDSLPSINAVDGRRRRQPTHTNIPASVVDSFLAPKLR